jgi:septal ring factor EnvC (AmiA/AmiB activator)
MYSDSSHRQWFERRLLDLECNFRMMNDRMTTFENRLQGLEQNYQNMQSRMDALEDQLHSFEPHAENMHLLNNWAAALENRLNMSQEFSRILAHLHNQVALAQHCRMQILEQSLQRLVLDQNHIQEQHQTLQDRMYDQNLKVQRLENLLLVEAL